MNTPVLNHPIVPPNGRRPHPIPAPVVVPKRRDMTLVIGIPCYDGFVISADSQETTGVKNHVRKLTVEDSSGYVLAVAICGETVAARTCSDLLSEAIRETKGPGILTARKVLRNALKTFYQGLPEFTSPNGSNQSDVQALIGYRDKKGIAQLYHASQGGFALQHAFVAIGMASGLANYLAARRFNRFGTYTVTTSVARHWARQIMSEGRADPSVGGNIETLSVRNQPPNGPPFFEVSEPNVQDTYLWGTYQQLLWAIENALNGRQAAASNHLERLAKTIRELAVASNQEQRPRTDEATTRTDTDSPAAGYGRF